jgi:23S rRNA pseudouridine2605 synthase
MELDGDLLAPAKVRQGKVSGGVTQLSVTIHQGKNRQIRRMCEEARLNVLRLKRIREGEVLLDRQLRPGQWRKLSQEELLALSEMEHKIQ